jgi:23S rRNA (adenine-N6)-dimethyltransferase
MAADQRRSVVYSQNFLKRPALARELIARSTITPQDFVLEIGPGRGVLTWALAARCRQLVAIEKDHELAGRLSQELRELSNVAIFEADVLDLPLPLTPYKVFSNIPFNTTAAIVTKLTEAAAPPEDAWLAVQREAAERFIGEPRTTLAALLVQPWFETSVAHCFRSTDFVPPPRVEVVLLRFNKRGPPLVVDSERQHYRDFVTYGFTAWRPTVRDAYRDVLSAPELARLATETGIELRQRPSAMPFAHWLVLYRHFARHASLQQRGIIAGAEERLREQQGRLSKQHRSRARR